MIKTPTSSGKLYQQFRQSGREQQSLSCVWKPPDYLLKLVSETHFKQPEGRTNTNVSLSYDDRTDIKDTVWFLTCQPHQTPHTPRSATSGSSPWWRAWDDQGYRWFWVRNTKQNFKTQFQNRTYYNNDNAKRLTCRGFHVEQQTDHPFCRRVYTFRSNAVKGKVHTFLSKQGGTHLSPPRIKAVLRPVNFPNYYSSTEEEQESVTWQ